MGNQPGEAILLVNTTCDVLVLDQYAITDFEPTTGSLAVFPPDSVLAPGYQGLSVIVKSGV